MNRVVLVTGSSRGIGLSIAKTFAQDRNYTVIISSRKKADLETAAAAIKAETGNQNVHYFVCNYTNMSDIQKLFEYVKTTFGQLNVLVNNVALSLHFGLMMDTPESAFDKMITGNLKSHFVTSQKFLPIMPAKSNSSIIFISSYVGLNPDPSIGVYSVTKTALNGLTLALSRELSDREIRVNCICPGLIKTDLSKVIWESGQPMMKLGFPEDIANVVHFVCSQKGNFVNGAIIPVVGQPISTL